MSPAISVIMPVYNTPEKYLREAIESVLNQTLEDFEFIIIDDASTTDIRSIITSYKDSRIKYFESKVNKGPSIARNAGIKKSIGEYIFFLDADDYIDTNFLQNAYLKSKKDNLDIVFLHTYIIDAQTDTICKINPYNTDSQDRLENLVVSGDSDIILNNYFDYSVTIWNKLFKTEFLKSNNLYFIPDLLIAQDKEFFLRTLLEAKRISLTNESIYFHRDNVQGSQIKGGSKRHFAIFSVCEAIENNLKKHNLFERMKKSVFKNNIYSFQYHYQFLNNNLRNEYIALCKKKLTRMEKQEHSLYQSDSDVFKNFITYIKTDTKTFSSDISIIMPVYNTSEIYLRKAIDSVLNQEFKNFEFIIINDGSTDENVEKIILSYNDTRIKYIKTTNQGVSNARNIGIQNAKGKYTIFIDADDYLDNCFFHNVLLIEEMQDLDILLLSIHTIDEKTGLSKKRNSLVEKNIFTNNTLKKNNMNLLRLFFELNTAIWGKVFNTEFLKTNNLLFSTDLKVGEDTEFLFRSMIQTSKVNYTENAIYWHRINVENSLVASGNEKLFDYIKMYNYIEKILQSSNLVKNEQIMLHFFDAKIKHLNDIYENLRAELKPKFYTLVEKEIKKMPLQKILKEDGDEKTLCILEKYIIKTEKFREDIMLSVIMPVYNTKEEYLRKAIESVLNQTYKNFEFIIVNDGSTNNSEKVINSYSDNRIKYLKVENGGQSRARNIGIKEASGEYIFFIDSDDWIVEYTFLRLMNKILKTKSQIVIFNTIDIEEITHEKGLFANNMTTFPISNNTFNIKNKEFENLFAMNLTAWSKLYNTKFLKQNNLYFTEDMIYEDIEHSIRSILCAEKIAVSHEAFYYYRTNTYNSTITTQSEKQFDCIKAFNLIESTLKKYNQFERFKLYFYSYKIAFYRERLDKYPTMEFFNLIHNDLCNMKNIFTLREIEKFPFDVLKNLASFKIIKEPVSNHF